jgi:pyruvate/2-oxoglutarate dehydrogenase complex dihydrolipoamide dehydrogenase (E3) component
MRPLPDQSESEFLASLVKNQGEIKAAKKVVIIGGGAVGLEFAGVSQIYV